MDNLIANCRVRLRDAEGRIIWKANKKQPVPAWVIERDPSLRAKCDSPEELAAKEAAEKAAKSPPPVSQPQAADDGPGAEPAGATPAPEPVAAPEPAPPKPRGRPKGSRNKPKA